MMNEPIAWREVENTEFNPGTDILLIDTEDYSGMAWASADGSKLYIENYYGTFEVDLPALGLTIVNHDSD